MVLTIIGWFFGISLLVMGLQSIFYGSLIGGVIILFASLFSLPPVLAKINQENKKANQESGKQHQDFTQGKGLVSSLVVFVIGALFLPTDSTTKGVSPSANKVITYEVLGSRDFSFPGRERIGVFVYAPEAKTKQERAAVVKQAALDLQKSSGADFTDAALELERISYGENTAAAMANYAPDGCGVSGSNCSGVKWEIEVANIDSQIVDGKTRVHVSGLSPFTETVDNDIQVVKKQ